MDREREKLIGARLRAFRETLQIPRSKFAVSIQFGSERLASYESGRAPLRYEVFHAVTQKYFVNPFWLATGFGSPRLPMSFNDADILPLVKPRMLFTEVYDTYLASKFEPQSTEAEHQLTEMKKQLLSAFEVLSDDSISPVKRQQMSKQLSGAVDKMVSRLKSERRLGEHPNKGLPQISEPTDNRKDNLDIQKAPDNLSEMRSEVPTWPELKKTVLRLTTERGEKSALAKRLGVSRQVLGNWLSDDAQGTPNAELTLKLLTWVEERKRKK